MQQHSVSTTVGKSPKFGLEEGYPLHLIAEDVTMTKSGTALITGLSVVLRMLSSSMVLMQKLGSDGDKVKVVRTNSEGGI
jgi:hypothetical protein